MIAYMYQTFGTCNACGQIPKSIHQASYLLPSDFPKQFFLSSFLFKLNEKLLNSAKTNIEVSFKNKLNAKNIFCEALFLVTFNIIINYIFSVNFIEFHQVSQKI